MREIPCSPSISSAFALSATADDPAMRHAQLSLSLGEPLAATKLSEAWDQIAQAHPLLHSGFIRQADGEIVVREGDPRGFHWQHLDWSRTEPDLISADWTALQSAELHASISLETPSLIRGTSIDLPGGHTHLLLTFPSFLLDDNAVFVCLSQWLALLDGASAPQHSPSAPPPAPDHATIDWWHKYQSGASRPLRLRFPAGPSLSPSSPRQVGRLFTREHSRRICDLAAKLSISPRIIFSGLAALLLGRLGASRHVLWLANGSFGTPLLPQCIPLENDLSLETWLQKLAASEQDRELHSTISLSRALSLLPAESRSLPFPVAFLWSPPILNDLIHDTFPRWMNVDARITRPSPAPLTLEVRNAGRFSVEIHYDSSLCSDSQATALLDRFDRSLETILEEPSVKLSAIDLLTDTERQSSSRFSSGVPFSHQPKRIEDRICETASRLGNDLAIQGDGETGLSYSEVAAHARSLAAYLRHENHADGWVIAICLTPTPWVPVALLGVLLAGDTCVPLDPSSSPTWLAGKASSCDAEIIICDSQTARLFEGSTRRILTIDRQWEEISAIPLSSATAIAPKSAILLTGTEYDPSPPLNVLSPQTLAAACKESSARWRLRAGDRIPLLATAGTGNFVETVLSALASGATILLPASGEPSLSALPAPTHLRLTLAQWRQLVIDLHRQIQSCPESIRAVTIEGAPIPSSLFALWQTLVPEHVSTHFFWSPAGFSGLSIRAFHKGRSPLLPIPIGTPSPGLSVSLLDACGQELPAGFIGDASIHMLDDSGSSWTLPAWRDEEGLLYLVGDAPEEDLLRSLPDVVDASVCQMTDNGSSLRGAWLITSQPSITLPPDLQHAAENCFAPSRSPSFILGLERWPLTSAGQIDTRRLPSPPPPQPVKAVVAKATPAPSSSSSRPAPQPSAVPAREWEPLRLLSKQAGAPILCFVHDIDGNPAKYQSLATLLADDWTSYATTARGFVQPSACHQTVESEAASFVEALCSLDPLGPYHLCGHGYGAVLAFEMARQLRLTGKPVHYLALLGSHPPQLLGSRHWLRPLTRLFRGQPSPSPIPDTPVAQAHAAALQEYRAGTLEGPAGIILGPDLGKEVENEWLVCAPEGFIERMSSPSDQMLVEPAVKRLAVILREWTETNSEES